MRFRASLLLLFAFCAGPVSAGPIVLVEPANATYNVGDTFSLNVAIDGAVDLFAFQFDLVFDPAVVSAAASSEGPFLGLGGLTFFVPGDATVPGTITSTANSLIGNVPGVAGSGVLATVSFTALGPGSSGVTLSNVILLDSTFAAIADTTLRNASVTVNARVPEPTTLLILGIGVAALGYRRGRPTAA